MKRYPFNATKHAHDIEFRYNRAYNEMRDMEEEGKINDKYYALDALHGRLEDLLSQCMGGGIVWLIGKDWALANECINWAAIIRN